MAGVGRPMTVQLKVTLEPVKALWFFGFSTTSGNRRRGTFVVSGGLEFSAKLPVKSTMASKWKLWGDGANFLNFTYN